MNARLLIGALALALGGCTNDVLAPDALQDPNDLTYELIPSGDPSRPDGILLRWTHPDDDRIASYVVYSRASRGDEWSRRAETTSSTFHDAGIPHLQYYVASVDLDGEEGRGSNIVTVAERNFLPAPSALRSTSLDRAVHLAWDDAAATQAGFGYYRVYSAPADRWDGGCSGDRQWVLEGTTVSADFLATGLTNGVPRCYAVSVVDAQGHESAWSPVRVDTPRYESRFVILDAFQDSAANSGFLFHDRNTSTFGLRTSGSRTDLDFRVERATDGSLWFVPVRSDVRVVLYATEPVERLEDIDIAPEDSRFNAAGAETPIEIVPGYAYVFRVTYADGWHYGAVRAQHTGAGYVVFDWSYQSQPNNPELSIVAPAAAIAP